MLIIESYVIIDKKQNIPEIKENEEEHDTNTSSSYQRILIYYSPNEGKSNPDPVTLTDLASSISPYTGAPYITHIEICTLHLCKFSDGSFIHINDFAPSNSNFSSLKKSIASTQNAGIKVLFMLGGEEGVSGLSPSSSSSWVNLFNDWDIFYPKLVDLIKEWNVNGIDLDVENRIDYTNICKLISSLHTDFGDSFDIALAPVASAIYDDNSNGGLSGFDYKTLMDSSSGSYISWLNLQFYNNWGTLTSPNEYERCITQGFKPQQLVAGMENCSVAQESVTQDTIKSLSDDYKTNFGGVFVWEGNDTRVIEWSKIVANGLSG